MKVKFLPSGKEVEIRPNQSVMEAAHENGIFIKTVCNGVPNCAECRVRVVEGEYNLLPPSSKELALIGSGHFIDQRRLSCQLHCFGDVTVDLSEQVAKENEGPPGSRRFQIELRNEGVVSQAVTGNLLQQDQEVLKEIELEPSNSRDNRHRGKDKKRRFSHNRDKNHNGNHGKRNQNFQNKKQEFSSSSKKSRS